MSTVWVTRPIVRAQSLATTLRKYHLEPWLKPAMRIVGIRGALQQFIAEAKHFDIAIFVSAETVMRSQFLLPADYLPLTMLPIGASTRAAMIKAGYIPSSLNNDNIGDTAALLALKILQPAQVRGKNIVILGGISGDNPLSLSPILCKALRRRGANVVTIATYRRLSPAPFYNDENKRLQYLAAAKKLCAVAYSSDTARHMLDMAAPPNDWLRDLPLFVIHPHIMKTAKQLGYARPFLAPADNDNMAATISHFLSDRLHNFADGL